MTSPISTGYPPSGPRVPEATSSSIMDQETNHVGSFLKSQQFKLKCVDRNQEVPKSSPRQFPSSDRATILEHTVSIIDEIPASQSLVPSRIALEEDVLWTWVMEQHSPFPGKQSTQTNSRQQFYSLVPVVFIQRNGNSLFKYQEQQVPKE